MFEKYSGLKILCYRDSCRYYICWTYVILKYRYVYYDISGTSFIIIKVRLVSQEIQVLSVIQCK